MRFKSLKLKLLIQLSVCIIMLLAVLLTISIRFTRSAAIQDAQTISHQIAKEQALLIQKRFNDGFTIGRTLSQSIEAIVQSDRPADRDQIVEILKRTGDANPELFGVWAAFEPNVYGKDSENVTAMTHSTEKGIFAPYWNRKNGALALYACSNLNLPWYTYSLNTKEESASAVTAYKDRKGLTFTISSLSVPAIVNGRAIGVVGVDLSADFLNNIVNNVNGFEGHGSMSLIAPTGNIQAATDMPDILGTPYKDIVDGGLQLFKRAQNGEIVFEETDEDLRLLMPVHFGKSKANWVVTLSVPMNVVLAEANALTQTLIITGCCCLLLAFACIFYLAGLIAHPIVQTSSVISDIANGTLSSRCIVKGHDEIADMQQAVNTMAVKLQENMEEIDRNMKEVRLRSEEAEKATVQAEKAEKEASKAHRQGQLAAADQLEEFVHDLTTVSADMNENVRTTAEGVSQQDARNSETATAMEEMNSTILEVARNASEAATSVDIVFHEAKSGLKVVEESVSTIQNVYSLSENMKKEMSDLGTQVQSISDILDVISDIADQTNLLALNAAIEAARAGDAGRGFAVVADEVRKLAEKTMDATRHVGNAIQTIQSGTHQNIEAMTNTADAVEIATKLVTESGDAFKRIVAKVTPATDQVRAIATAAEQQSSASEEITHALEEIGHISTVTAERMRDAENSVRDLSTVSDLLKNMIVELKED
ncbi:methyl-accepting chemotaxis protein [Halodesulfovibrio marinisediminis]|uniref:Methyl-accepting chemotaxis sensory transducer with Cache sensor n=1 Tax=Halodesulfovibrio marinisediminis DSM 17456 TaxID=1121457 RepID=A0A1N6IA84_9BACT|nr:methyl-accepting chemotaxis protein [Halodesulfovibrio marinisediminis]SIO28893.1 methyl-accepting chemotaxis sensory transducer with Cache sensor [Halodesulfovibrio marinisediminis DSM 17456]